MAAIDTVVADTLDRATDGFLTYAQVSERLTAEAGTLDRASDDRTHLDALRGAVCFRLTADGTFYGAFAGDGTAPWPRRPLRLRASSSTRRPARKRARDAAYRSTPEAAMFRAISGG